MIIYNAELCKEKQIINKRKLEIQIMDIIKSTNCTLLFPQYDTAGFALKVMTMVTYYRLWQFCFQE